MNMNSQDQIGYLFSIQQQIHDNIKFADQKALVIIVIDTSLIGATHGTKVLGTSTSWQLVLALLALSLLSLGVLFGVWVIRPRLRGAKGRRPGMGFTDQARIVLWASNEESYQRKYASLDYDEFRNDLLMFVLDRSKVDEAKYAWLRRAIWMSLSGWIAALLLFLSLGFQRTS